MNKHTDRLLRIRNKNELRVIGLISQVLEEYPDWEPDGLDIEDVYALTLNQLPARYVQPGSIVLREPVHNDAILKSIREAIATVRSRPNH